MQQSVEPSQNVGYFKLPGFNLTRPKSNRFKITIAAKYGTKLMCSKKNTELCVML